jgi:hypothetical protein
MAEHALFICYSHTDQRYREQFSKFLATVKEQKGVDVFSDAEIKPGDDWQKTIIDNLRKATAALVLVSQDVLVSPFTAFVFSWLRSGPSPTRAGTWTSSSGRARPTSRCRCCPRPSRKSRWSTSA